ncbi:site-2 protease family protein [Marimonas lutisalis]|uniref:site-2 protease family protein n=1 Tax=Marimonas lutisalis TaxID=2545756 RepID=UPI0010F90213|nr:site-2 protease family protein [Marimonas lutisalis]
MLQTGPILFSFRGVLGITIEVGQTLVMLIALLAVLTLSAGADAVWVITLLAMILAIIYLHELGHAWACLVQGVPVRRIVLHGGGGFCEQARAGSRHEQELIVVMGPLTNLALWAIASLAAQWVWDNGTGAGALGHYLSLFAVLNLAFFIFNLIPVQPLDGGRLLYLVLLRAVARPRAVRITGAVGLIFAVLWWPALLYVFLSTGWLLLFMPSIALHLRMMRGQITI